MLAEALENLAIIPGNWYIDATLGQGGHTAAMLSAGARVIAFDWDDEAVSTAATKFVREQESGDLIVVHENFSKLKESLEQIDSTKIGHISGILFDFGTSTNQLMSAERGFSFDGDGVLDMRMDRRLGVLAKDILALVPEKQLAQLFINEGGEYLGKKIAKAIKMSPAPIQTVSQLSKLIMTVYGGRHGKIHPATKVFQALRIAVNSELTNIEAALPQAYLLLAPAGRLVTIAFHEGEDRIIKQLLNAWHNRGLGTMMSKRVMTPSEAELERNPRARSAKLRVFEKK